MRTRVGIPLVVVLLLAALAAADSDRGEIRGTVTDTAGGVIPGVTVTITGPERRTTVTTERGEFAFTNLLPGSYETHAEIAGFVTAVANATVRAGLTERLAFRLSPSAVSETITVTGERPSLAKGVLGGILSGVHESVSGGVPAAPPPYLRGRYNDNFNTEAYDHLEENPFRRVVVDPLSTFSIDVDTASYANVRRFLNDSALPPVGAVRIEELINYFHFDYAQPAGDAPFSITTELAQCPWNTTHQLALIGLQGRELPEEELPPRNLVFLIDVSGSMDEPDKLPLVQKGMRMLVDVLTARDRVAIVVYAGSSGLVLPSTPGDRKAAIGGAIAELRPGGSTNGAAGITLAYQIARERFVRGGVNRVILATDGDFNVGVTSQDALVRLIEEQRASGIFLSVLGVGTGNLKDSTMEKLADKGNGNYAYLDSLHEARKVLVREAGGTLVTIAKDVKIQVEFNPAAVSAYRLIGYENRLLRNEDFKDDTKDAGEIGSGHSVTALYEIVPAGGEVDAPSLDPLRYQRRPERTGVASSDELVTVKLRYKAPDGDASRLVSTVVRRRSQPMTANVGFASAVAEFGMLLRGSKQIGAGSFDSAIARARTFKGDDPEGYRAEFIRLAELGKQLQRAETTRHQDTRR